MYIYNIKPITSSKAKQYNEPAIKAPTKKSYVRVGDKKVKIVITKI